MLGRITLPIILAIIIAVIVSFAVQGFISFVSLISTYLRGEDHILLGLPREILILSGPIIAGILVSLIYKIANLDKLLPRCELKCLCNIRGNTK